MNGEDQGLILLNYFNEEWAWCYPICGIVILISVVQLLLEYFLKDEKDTREGFSTGDTFEDVKKIIVVLLNVDESKVTPEARFREDLEADSPDLVELIMAFEGTFGGEISDEDAQQISTVGEAVKYIDDHMGS